MQQNGDSTFRAGLQDVQLNAIRLYMAIFEFHQKPITSIKRDEIVPDKLSNSVSILFLRRVKR
jgi:hypothetical protein